MKKILSIVLCIALVFSLSTAVFASDNGTGEISGTYTYCPSMGILGAPNQTSTFTYSDEYFTKSGYNLTKDLSVISMNFVQASFGSSGNDYANANENQKDFLAKCGFTGYEANEQYTSHTSTNSIGVGAASKKIEDNGAEYTLVAVGIRGHNYFKEWGGDLYCGETGDHTGFAICRDEVIRFLKQYVSDQNITGKIKLWIVGYSRSAITANMVGGYIDQGKVDFGSNVTLSKNDLYCYCYEPPLGVDDDNADAAVYGNIHNILNPADVVPLMPFESWGYTRYGVDHYVPGSTTDSDYNTLKLNMLPTFSTYLLSQPYLIDTFVMYDLDPTTNSILPIGTKVTQKEFYEMLEEAIVRDFVPDRETFVNVYQDDLMELMETLLGIDTDDLMSALTSFATNLSENAGSLVTTMLTGDISSSVDAILDCLVDAMQKNNVINFNREQISSILTDMMPGLLNFVKNDPEIVVTLLANILTILSAHYSELGISWLKTLPDDYLSSQQDYQYSGAFKDVNSNDWYAKYADYVNYGGIMVGDSGNFNPNASMTRAMFVQTLYAIAGKPSVSAKTSFSDVSSSQWYANAVAWASENGIVAGFEDGTFAPDQAVTREQMALMLYKYTKSIDGDTATSSLSYKDAASVSEWATEGVSWATAKGVIAGSDDGYLYPQNECTRAQAAAMLRSFCEAY